MKKARPPPTIIFFNVISLVKARHNKNEAVDVGYDKH